MPMGVEPVSAIAATQSALPLDETSGAASATAPQKFASLLEGKWSDLEASVGSAETTLRDLAAGKAVEPQEAMITMERARISVLTFVQLRNRLIESYQDVMRMQL